MGEEVQLVAALFHLPSLMPQMFMEPWTLGTSSVSISQNNFCDIKNSPLGKDLTGSPPLLYMPTDVAKNAFA